MVAVWTAIAVLAGFSFSTLFYLGHRIDQLGANLGAEIRELGIRIDGTNSRLDGTNSRLDGTNGRLAAGLNALTARIDAHLEWHAQLE